MVNHYTAHKRPRSDDAYTPGGVAGRRPGPGDERVRAALPRGVRRDDAHRDRGHRGVAPPHSRTTTTGTTGCCPSILVPSGADLLVYGQGEKPVLEIARRLASGEDVCGLVDVPGTAVLLQDLALAGLDGRARGDGRAPALRGDRRRPAPLRRVQPPLPPGAQRGQRARSWCSATGRGARARTLVVNEPMPPPTTEELDRIAELPYAREAHPVLRRGAHPGARADPLVHPDPARLRRRLRVLLHHRAPGAGRRVALRGERAARGGGPRLARRASGGPSPTSAARPPTCGG